MKLQHTFSLLAALALSQLSSMSIHAKEKSIKRRDRRANKNRRGYGRPLLISSQTKMYEQLPPPETMTVSTSVVGPSASSSSSFLLRRDLKKDVSKNFKQCSDCSVGVTTMDDNCCAGGVSFLKIEFHSPQGKSNGTITLGSAQSCQSSHGHKGTKAGGYPEGSISSSNSKLRIVDCDDICIQKPFGGHPCDADSVVNEKDVVSGTEICIAMVRPTDRLYEYEIAFDEKMEHNLYVLLLSSEGFSKGVIHTSCSKPLTHSWGVLFENCVNSTSGSGKKKYEHVDVSNGMGNSTAYLSFIDGISTEYFIAASDALVAPNTSSYSKTLDIGFNECGCTCERYKSTIPSPPPNTHMFPSSGPSEGPIATPSLVPSPAPTAKDPTSSPTLDSTSMPTKNPSSNPSPAPTLASTSTITSSSTPSDTSLVNPGPGSPTAKACNSACSAFIQQHCVFVATNNVCDINALVSVVADDDNDQVAGGAAAPLPTETNIETGAGKGAKGTKGSVMKGFGKSGYGKEGEKGEKGAGLDKGGKLSRKKSTYSKLTKQNKEKGGKGRHLSSTFEYERHLQKIEYHQSRIDYFEKLLMHIDV